MVYCFNYVIKTKNANPVLFSPEGKIIINKDFYEYDIVKELCMFIGRVGLFKGFNPIDTYYSIISKNKYKEEILQMLLRMYEESDIYLSEQGKNIKKQESEIKKVGNNGK